MKKTTKIEEAMLNICSNITRDNQGTTRIPVQHNRWIYACDGCRIMSVRENLVDRSILPIVKDDERANRLIEMLKSIRDQDVFENDFFKDKKKIAEWKSAARKRYDDAVPKEERHRIVYIANIDNGNSGKYKINLGWVEKAMAAAGTRKIYIPSVYRGPAWVCNEDFTVKTVILPINIVGFNDSVIAYEPYTGKYY